MSKTRLDDLFNELEQISMGSRLISKLIDDLDPETVSEEELESLKTSLFELSEALDNLSIKVKEHKEVCA
jgi:hypothetical protein